MDNFLTTLYFTYFKNSIEEKRLRAIRAFDSENLEIRNDQSILECQKRRDLLKELIGKYMKQLR